MKIVIHRVVRGQHYVAQPACERMVTDGFNWRRPGDEPGLVGFAQGCCRYMQEFYLRHGVPCYHYLCIIDGVSLRHLVVDERVLPSENIWGPVQTFKENT